MTCPRREHSSSEAVNSRLAAVWRWPRARAFYDVTTAGLVLFAIAGLLTTAYLAGRSRRWTALLVALSPGLIVAAFINWDLIAMALTAGAMAAWAAGPGPGAPRIRG